LESKLSLSPRQREVLDFIKKHLEIQGFPPSYREIGAALDIGSTNAVRDHILALERKGFLERKGSRSRGLTLTLPPEELERDHEQANPGMVSVPVLGPVAAGQPLWADGNIQGRLNVDSSLVRRGGKCFALKVVGDSMIEEGIFEGDMLVVRAQPDAEDGTIVVALVDDEATVKRIYREDGRVRLQPSNAAMSPIFPRMDEGTTTVVQGVVVAVLRVLDA